MRRRLRHKVLGQIVEQRLAFSKWSHGGGGRLEWIEGGGWIKGRLGVGWEREEGVATWREGGEGVESQGIVGAVPVRAPDDRHAWAYEHIGGGVVHRVRHKVST